MKSHWTTGRTVRQRRQGALREGYSVRGKPLLFDDMLADLPKPKIVLENPRRTP